MADQKEEKKCVVYRYIDNDDQIIKYVGIVTKSQLNNRLAAHKSKDTWNKEANWRIEYFECENQSEAEAFESHLITLYQTNKYFNKMKSNWGINKYLPDVESWWRVAQEPIFDDKETLHLSQIIKRLIHEKKIVLAAQILDNYELVQRM